MCGNEDCPCCASAKAFAITVIRLTSDFDTAAIEAARDAGLVERPPPDDEDEADETQEATDLERRPTPSADGEPVLTRLAGLLIGGPRPVRVLAERLGLPEPDVRRLVKSAPDRLGLKRGTGGGVVLTERGRAELTERIA